MNIGQLNKPIRIGHIEAQINENGFPDGEKFVPEFTSWASIQNLYGREFWEAKAQQLEETIKFIIRYNKNLSYNHVISFNNETYKIIHINNIDFANRFMEIKATILSKDKN